jgi:tetraacyldisaccharide 4'-kinase
MHIKGNSTIYKLKCFLLNGVSFVFKTLSLINLTLKSLEQKKFPGVVIISIDNLSFGGTGKTSLVMEIGKHFEKKNIKFAIISRGYKSKFENQCTKVQPDHGFKEVGDEAVMFKKRFPGQDIYVGKNRRQSIERAMRDRNTIILMDDGFQSTHIRKDIKIMLFNPDHPYYYLRNFKFLMKKEDFIFFYNSHLKEEDEKKFKPATCGIYHFEPDHFFDIKGKRVNAEGSSLFGFSGLGDNLRFKNDLSAFNLKEFRGFSDHHAYTGDEIARLNRLRKEKKIDYLVCTEKDFIKLGGINLKNIPLIFVQNSIKFNIDLMGYLLEYAEKKNYTKTSG